MATKLITSCSCIVKRSIGEKLETTRSGHYQSKMLIPRRMALLKLALVKSASLKLTLIRLPRNRLALLNLASTRMAPLRSAPLRMARERSNEQCGN